MKREHEARRTFLKSVLAGSAVAAGVVTAGGRVAGAGTTDRQRRPAEILHRDTEEFRRYYETLKA